MTDITANAADAAVIRRSRMRRRAIWIVATIFIVGLIAWGIYWLVYDRFFVTTDDAYVGGYVVSVTAREPGTVLAIRADNTQIVKKGDVLVEFDPSSADIALAAAKADLARTVRQVRGLYARADSAQSQIAQARTQLATAQGNYDRRKKAGAGAVSAEDLAHAADALRVARAAFDTARHQRAEIEAEIEGPDLAHNPDVLAAAARLRAAILVRDHMTLYAPADGVIAQRSVQVGTQVAPGTPLMAVVPLYSLWVDANFKEVQLADIRVGQPVTVTTDTYGSGVVFHGHVAGFSPGTGNAFALLPPQNATGNWIKIVQRLPVRIALDHPQELKDHPLRVGLSTIVSVDVSDTSGSLMRSTVKTDLRDRTDETRKARSDAMIAQIIAANTGGTAADSTATGNTRVTQ